MKRMAQTPHLSSSCFVHTGNDSGVAKNHSAAWNRPLRFKHRAVLEHPLCCKATRPAHRHSADSAGRPEGAAAAEYRLLSSLPAGHTVCRSGSILNHARRRNHVAPDRHQTDACGPDQESCRTRHANGHRCSVADLHGKRLSVRDDGLTEQRAHSGRQQPQRLFAEH